MPELTDDKAETNTYTILHNELTHCPIFLKGTNYHPGNITDDDFNNVNTSYPYESKNYYWDLKTFEVNASSLLLLGRYVDYLQNEGLYDNTRIIIVSDHGAVDTIRKFAEGFSDNYDYASYNPLLLVKDFNSHGELKTDYKFMTNADTVYLTLQGLGINMENPYTGNAFEKNIQTEFNVYEVGNAWNAFKYVNDTVFRLTTNRGYHISNNIFDEKNWIPLKQYFAENQAEKKYEVWFKRGE